MEDPEESENEEGTLALIETNDMEVGELLGITLHAIAGSLALQIFILPKGGDRETSG